MRDRIRDPHEAASGDRYEKIGSRGGLCVIKGDDRLTQTDTVACDESPASASFATFHPQQQKQVMKKIFAELHEKCSTVPEEQKKPSEAQEESTDPGSCACIATGYVKKDTAVVSTSYVGDSVSFLVVVHPNGTSEVKACNPALHDLNNNQEVQAIKTGRGRAKGTLTYDAWNGYKLADGLVVTRAIGDSRFDEKGISHEPETTLAEVKIQPGAQVFMVVGCDGMMEHCKGTEIIADYTRELGEVFSDWYRSKDKESSPEELSLEKIAKKIVDNAYEKGSNDNISVMVIPLEPDKPAVTAAVFDSHTRSWAAEVLGKQFQSCFTTGIQAEIQAVIQRGARLHQAFNDYRNHLNNERIKHPYDQDLAAKNRIMQQLEAVYKENDNSLENLPAIKAILENESEQDPTKTNLEILTKQRYAYQGLKHSIIAVAKMIFLALPALISDYFSSGKNGAYQKLFPVKGHDFVEKIKKAEENPTPSSNKTI